MKSISRAVSLIELILGLVLLSLIVLALNNVTYFGNFQLSSANRRTKMQNDATFVLAHMAKYIGRAIGDFSNPAIVAYADNKGIRVKIDSNGNGIRDDDATDLWVAYRHEEIGFPATDSEIRFYSNAGTGLSPAGTYEQLARHVVITNLAEPAELWGLAFYINLDLPGHLLENSLEVSVNFRWYPNQAAQVSSNPQIYMRSAIILHSVSTN